MITPPSGLTSQTCKDYNIDTVYTCFIQLCRIFFAPQKNENKITPEAADLRSSNKPNNQPNKQTSKQTKQTNKQTSAWFFPGKVARYDDVYRSCGPLNQLGGIGAHSNSPSQRWSGHCGWSPVGDYFPLKITYPALGTNPSYPSKG